MQIQVTGLAGAQAINGLRAVFGEQYPDPVRVVAVGGPGVQQMLDQPTEAEWAGYSSEFCVSASCLPAPLPPASLPPASLPPTSLLSYLPTSCHLPPASCPPPPAS